MATSDTHHAVDVKNIPDGDVFIHAGDMMTTGYLDEWWECLEWLSQLPHRRKILIPGNHDFHLQVYPGPALQELRKIKVEVIGLPGDAKFYTTRLKGGIMIGGFPCVINSERWAFNMTEEEIANELKKIGPIDIMVSHAPAQGILDFSSKGGNVGSYALREFIDRSKPKYLITGHIHEAYGHIEYDDIQCFNVSMCNIKGEQVNPPAVFDI